MNIDVIAQNAIRIETDDSKVVYFDPFKINGKSNDADIIFITHSHYDHFSPEDIEKVKNDNTKIVITTDLENKVKELGFDESSILQVIPNNSYDFSGISFSTIPAYNVLKPFHPKKNNWVGYIVNIDGKQIYVAGDTDNTKEAQSVKCDIAFVPVGGIYTMNAKEAAELIKEMMPNKMAIPTHYKTVVGSYQDALYFKDLLEGVVDVDILM